MNKPIFKSSNAQGEGLLGGVSRGGTLKVWIDRRITSSKSSQIEGSN